MPIDPDGSRNIAGPIEAEEEVNSALRVAEQPSADAMPVEDEEAVEVARIYCREFLGLPRHRKSRFMSILVIPSFGVGVQLALKARVLERNTERNLKKRRLSKSFPSLQ